MPRLDDKNAAALAALGPFVPFRITAASRGVWQGGRVYENEFGEVIFIPLGTKRAAIGIRTPLRFLGDGRRNTKGFGFEVELTNAVFNTGWVQ